MTDEMEEVEDMRSSRDERKQLNCFDGQLEGLKLFHRKTVSGAKKTGGDDQPEKMILDAKTWVSKILSLKQLDSKEN